MIGMAWQGQERKCMAWHGKAKKCNAWHANEGKGKEQYGKKRNDK
jgi:hypothetical protein